MIYDGERSDFPHKDLVIIKNLESNWDSKVQWVSAQQGRSLDCYNVWRSVGITLIAVLVQYHTVLYWDSHSCWTQMKCVGMLKSWVSLRIDCYNTAFESHWISWVRCVSAQQGRSPARLMRLTLIRTHTTQPETVTMCDDLLASQS